MEITLSQARKVEKAISGNFTTKNEFVNVNLIAHNATDLVTELNNLVTYNEVQTDITVKLLEAKRYLRKEIRKANAEVGIEDLLDEKAVNAQLTQLFNKLLHIQNQTELTNFWGSAVILNNKQALDQVFEQKFDLTNQPTIKFIKDYQGNPPAQLEIEKLKRRAKEIDNKLEELNHTTKIEIPEKIVKLLESNKVYI